MNEEHYLKTELYERLRNDPAIFEFLEGGSLDGVWYWDIENPDEEWYSPRFKSLLGYTEEEVPNKSTWWQERIYPEDLDLALENFQKHCEDRTFPYDQVVRYRHKDGSTVWIRCRGLALRNEKGELSRMLGVHTDLTAPKEEAIDLYDHSPDLMVSVDPSNGTIKECNQTVVTRLGYQNKRQIIGQPIFSLYHEDSLEEAQSCFQEFVAKGRVRNAHLWLKNADGSKREVLLNVDARRNERGEIVGSRSVWREVGDQTVLSLADRQRHLETIIDTAPVGMLVANNEGIIKLVNAQLCQDLDWDREHLVGKSIEVLVPQDKVQEHVGWRNEYAKNPERRSMAEGRELFARHKSGKKVLVDVRLNPMPDGHIVASVHLLTETRKRELALQQRNRDLEEFAYMASHDLRAPLRHISGFAALLEANLEERLSSNEKEYLKEIIGGAKRLQTMIQDIQALSRVSKPENLELQAIVLDETMERLARRFEGQLQDWELKTDQLPTLLAAPTHLDIVLQNLIENAIKYRHPDRLLVVEVRATDCGEHWEISVEDNGIGMEPALISKAFKMFQRLVTRQHSPGSGVGLPLVRKVVELYGGTVNAESVVGEGTRFFFTWRKEVDV